MQLSRDTEPQVGLRDGSRVFKWASCGSISTQDVRHVSRPLQQELLARFKRTPGKQSKGKNLAGNDRASRIRRIFASQARLSFSPLLLSVLISLFCEYRKW